MAYTHSENKRLIPLYLQELFIQRTDETHYITMKEIQSFLHTKNIYADRRTIYSAISLLNEADFGIVGVHGKGEYKYHLPKRILDKNELKFLIDSIAASKFLTEKKSNELIKKVKSFGSSYEIDVFHRRILHGKRIKTMNDKVLKNLDSLYLAIERQKQITFQYMRWNPQRKLEVQKAGKLYQVSPYGISLSEDNYYLIAYDSAADCLKHYRIDKMQAIRMTEESREGNALFESFDIVDYSRKTFSMFGGREEVVNMECPNRLIGAFIDRFGESAAIRPSFEKADYSIIRVAVNVSPQFFAWLFGLGQQVKLLSPDLVIAEYQKMLSEISANYD